MFQDPAVRSVFILARHDAHADLVAQGLAAGKAVFVEKPLAIDAEGLSRVRAVVGEQPQQLTVGFNRRFAPHVQKMTALLKTVDAPKSMMMTVNAGRLPAGHWLKQRDTGGGRLLGEGCHFIDLLRHVAGAPITDVHAMGMHTDPQDPTDSFQVTLRFTDGSVGTRMVGSDAGAVRTLVDGRWAAYGPSGFPFGLRLHSPWSGVFRFQRPPRRTVRAVLPHTAHRRCSPSSIRFLPP